ncbi:hypothetical protein TD95_002441 [Thielaviopsis punctulata]|uniref:RNase P subunit Pop3 n=1 Tax=Thielaviopsis punctulata TaxID=72032 RepID=A0A0F4Z8N1_9PEZI|nr:hypothetical protein TD95_002441 [Thielaviopsis punctulata]
MSKLQPQVRKKTVYQLGTPFTTTQWPETSQAQKDAILELLCTFLEPLGRYRQQHIAPSKGKSSRKRKRDAIKKSASKEGGMDIDRVCSEKPPVPEIAAYVDVGLSAITRNLQDIAVPSRSSGKSEASEPILAKKQPYAAVFVAKSGQVSMLHNHFPELVAAASRNPAVSSHIKLVGFSQTCAEKLTKALGLPRVSAIAIRSDAPQSKALFEYLKANVPRVSSAWIDSATGDFHFIPPNIVAVQTPIGQKKMRNDANNQKGVSASK